MLIKSHLNSMNSLQTQSIRQFVSRYRNRTDVHFDDRRWDQLNISSLNIHLRQTIVDYLIEEKAMVSSKLIQSLISGGLLSLDFWRLCDSNKWTTTEISALLNTIANNSHCFESLSLGGTDWIFNHRVIRGPLKKLFETKLNRLVTLRMQQIDTGDQLLAVLKACPQLKRLEIRYPSVTDRDIDRIEQQLKSCECIERMKELLLPSSIKCRGLMKMLAIFSNTKTLKCTPFEQLMDLIDYSMTSSQSTTALETASKAKATLSSITSLTIIHPMGCDSTERLVGMCPRLKRLSLELQECMQLSAITRLDAIKHLEFRNSPSMPLDYSTQVLPILESKGIQLESLSLEHFDVVDLITCAKLCPNLNRFSAQWFTILGYFRRDMPSILRDRHLKTPFSNLTHVRLRPLSQRNIPSDACAFILANARQLTHIELYCCYDLSDADVQALQTKNPLTHLRSLILRHGHKVTKEALNLLVSRAQELSFIDCGIPLTKDELAPEP